MQIKNENDKRESREKLNMSSAWLMLGFRNELRLSIKLSDAILSKPRKKLQRSRMVGS